MSMSTNVSSCSYLVILTANFLLVALLATELRLEGGDELLVVWGQDGETSWNGQFNLESADWKCFQNEMLILSDNRIHIVNTILISRHLRGTGDNPQIEHRKLK